MARAIFLVQSSVAVPEMLADLQALAVRNVTPPPPEDLLDGWCRRYHVLDAWLRTCAADTYAELARNARARESGSAESHGKRPRLRWHRKSLSHSIPQDHVRDGEEELDLIALPREEMLARRLARKSFAGYTSGNSLSRRIAKMRNLLEEAQWTKPPTKSREHFTWLALYQFRGRSVTSLGQIREDGEILRDGTTDRARSTVTEAIRSVADIIGLSLRPPLGPGSP